MINTEPKSIEMKVVGTFLKGKEEIPTVRLSGSKGAKIEFPLEDEEDLKDFPSSMILTVDISKKQQQLIE